VEDVHPDDFFSFFRSAAAINLSGGGRNMYPLIQIKTTVPHSISRLPLRRGLVLIPLMFICLGLLPAVRAVTPQPDGTYASFNVAEGFNALLALTTGTSNTAIGFAALASNTTGNHNTAFGLNTMLFNTTGNFNMGIGGGCLRNSNGNNNTAIGFQAMSANTTASNNSAIGYQALFKNTTGTVNNAVGFQALYNNTTADYNNAHGRQALFTNTGTENNAFGDLALFSNTSGNTNTAMGDDALDSNTTGSSNTAVGDEAGAGITTGSNNTCIGKNAGLGISTASNQVAIGVAAAGPFANTSNTCFIRSIYNQPVSNGASQQDVFVDQFNVLGQAVSSRRFKHDIQPMDNASDVLLKLKPVTFKYNSDETGTTQYGLVAEEVAEVAPSLATHDNDGKVQSIRYQQINAMLLNEFLKEHRTVGKQQATIAELKSTVAQQQKGMEILTAQLKEQASQIQKVSARLEVSKPATKVAVGNQ
jgi:hypothetical protein